MKPHTAIILAAALLAPLSACDDSANTSSANRDAAANSSGVNGMSASGAPERGEMEKIGPKIGPKGERMAGTQPMPATEPHNASGAMGAPNPLNVERDLGRQTPNR